MRPTGRSVRRLQQASDAELQRVAAFQRPAWRATTIHAVALSDWAVARRAQETTTTKTIVKQVEVLERATLADVRKLIAVFCPDVPASFVFEWVYYQQQVAVTDLEETKVCVDNAELDGVLWLLYLPKTARQDVQEELTQGFPRDNPETLKTDVSTRSHDEPTPDFSVRQQFGAIVASIDVSLSYATVVFLSRCTIFDRKTLLAECTEMTESMVQIMLSSTRGQTQLLENVLARLSLSTDGARIAWEWTGNNDVESSDLRVRRRKAHHRPSPPPVSTWEKPSDRSTTQSLTHQSTAPELTSPPVVKSEATKQTAVASEDVILELLRRS